MDVSVKDCGGWFVLKSNSPLRFNFGVSGIGYGYF